MTKFDGPGIYVKQLFDKDPEEAKHHIAKELRNKPSDDFLSAVADILERPDVKMTGKTTWKPKLNFELMSFMGQVVVGGNMNREAAAAEAKDKFGVGRSTAFEALREFKEAKKAHDNIVREIREEKESKN